ncbi:hypothetical protein GF354_01075 [Candidatus Peregrinibacteria bacterium]|nr:hypothetical protein [Candidatus Peregrinibacteria bacterium]
MQSEQSAQFNDIFFSDVEENLQKMNKTLLEFEKDPSNTKLLDNLMRYSHNIKGASAMMGYNNLSNLTHVLEDVFDKARKGKSKINSRIIQRVFETFDFIAGFIDHLKKTSEETDVHAEIDDLKKIVEGAVSHEKNNETREYSQKQANKEQNSDKDNKQIEFIKVHVDRLDKLMDLIEELLINKMSMDSYLDTIQKKFNENEKKVISPFNQKFERLISDIQYYVMQARLVPVNQVFAKYPRMVRDLASSENKKIDFEMSGGELELDRKIVENLSDPITHLIRNAIDHGIKDEGRILLRAIRDKDQVVISVEDNGRGLNFQKIIDKALDLKLINKSDQDELLKLIPDSPGKVPVKIQDLLYCPSVSTKDKVNEISGRGVGLNVIDNFNKLMGGRSYIETKEQGTRFCIQLPLSVSIIKSLLVRLNNSVFAIPAMSVNGSIRFKKKDIRTSAGQDYIIVDREDIPIINLKEVFNYEDTEYTDKLFIVLAKNGDETVGLMVDEMINNMEIIVKPLNKVLHSIKAFSGATILADGKLALIIDINRMIDHIKINN